MRSNQLAVLPSTLNSLPKDKQLPIYYAPKAEIHPSWKHFRLKRLIAASKSLLGSPGLQNDDPELYFKAKDQLRIFERLLRQVEGAGSCQ